MGLKDLGIFAGVLAAWFVLSRWVLPWFGVPTCMSGNCGTGSCCPTEFPRAVQGAEDQKAPAAESADGPAPTESEPKDADKPELEVAK
jgi:hypothetical protein